MLPQDDIELHAKADTMNTDLEIITLREAKQTALEVRPATHPCMLPTAVRGRQLCWHSLPL